MKDVADFQVQMREMETQSLISTEEFSFSTDLLKMLHDVNNTTTETAQSLKIALSCSVQYKNSTLSLAGKHADQTVTNIHKI